MCPIMVIDHKITQVATIRTMTQLVGGSRDPVSPTEAGVSSAPIALTTPQTVLARAGATVAPPESSTTGNFRI